MLQPGDAAVNSERVLTYCFQPIGVIKSCFRDKFGVPRQPGLVEAARGQLVMFPPFDREEAFEGLADISHVWITFVFHRASADPARLMVRPPRLGGNEKKGVFATRSPFRPNPIGLSVVALEGIERDGPSLVLHLAGIDMIDDTPVLDVRPYVPYADCLPQARGGFAGEAPRGALAVEFSPSAAAALSRWRAQWPDIEQLIVGVLSLDPRPAYFKDLGRRRSFAIRLCDLEIRWEVDDGEGSVYVVEIQKKD